MHKCRLRFQQFHDSHRSFRLVQCLSIIDYRAKSLNSLSMTNHMSECRNWFSIPSYSQRMRQTTYTSILTIWRLNLIFTDLTRIEKCLNIQSSLKSHILLETLYITVRKCSSDEKRKLKFQIWKWKFSRPWNRVWIWRRLNNWSG